MSQRDINIYLVLDTDLTLQDVTDLINRILQVLKGDLYWVKIST